MMLVILLGALSITRMLVDIFPVIDIPMVPVVWNCPRLTTEDMVCRVVFISERAYLTTVNDISYIGSKLIPGVRILMVYFQAGNRNRRRHRAENPGQQNDPAHCTARNAAAGGNRIHRVEHSCYAIDDAIEDAG